MPPPITLSPNWKVNQHVILYHGTTMEFAEAILNAGVDPTRGARNRDFGRGFYTTTFRYQAVEWAGRIAGRSGGRSAVLWFRIALKKLSTLHSLAFVRPESDNELYWRFIAHCRQCPPTDLQPGQTPADYTHFYEHRDGQGMYDMVSGPVAKAWPENPHDTFTPEVIPGFDQFSFHTAKAAGIFNTLIRSRKARGKDYDIL